MRLNTKRLIIFALLSAALWFLVFYASVIDVPKLMPVQRTNLDEIEERIAKLEKQIVSQIEDSKTLLEKVKNHVNRDVPEPKEEKRKVEKAPPPSGKIVLPVLVIACDRVTVKRCLDNLVKFRTDEATFPIIVSQDCGHNATYKTIQKFVKSDPSISLVLQPDLSEIPLPKPKVKFRGYYKIARHYKFALNYVFKTLGHEAVIIVEDDLDISPDFFEYFLGTYPLLFKDPSLWCISAWNDNGKKEVIDQTRPELLHRTDFFPGLGWMLRKHMWEQLETKWPPAFFDDWLRNPMNIDNKSCIRPEISRTYSFGKIGVSKGLFFDKHLRNIQLNIDYIEFTKLDLDYMIKETYDKELYEYVESLPEVSADEVVSAAAATAVRVAYSDAASYRRNAKKLGLMDDFRSGVPRTAYQGIVTCFVRGIRVYLMPRDWKGYDPKWG